MSVLVYPNVKQAPLQGMNGMWGGVGSNLVGGGAGDSPSPTGSYSVDLDGTGDFLTVDDGSDFHMGTGDFTIECWAYFHDTANRGVWQLSDSATGLDTGGGGGATTLAVAHNGGNWHCYTGSSGQLNAGGSRSANTWYHLAYVRSSGTTKIYVNGTSQGSISDTYDYNDTTTLAIGGYYTTSYLMDGLISNFRITKGQALYTSNFTSATSLLTTTSQSATESNVKLLCCQNNAIDGFTTKPSGTTITENGDPSLSTDDPF